MIYVCKNCGHVLFRFEFGQDFYGPRTPGDIKTMYAGVCPRCGHELTVPDLKDIEFRPRVRWKHDITYQKVRE